MNYISFSPFPVLETERLMLRKVEKSDAEYIFKLRSDETYSKWTGVKRYEDLIEAEKYLEKIGRMIDRNEVASWSILLKDTTHYVGGIALWNISDNKTQAEIGYDLLPEFRGKGYIQEAIRAVINFAFEELNMEKIVANEVRMENIKSVKVLEGIGFQLEKTLEVQTVEGNMELRANFVLSRSIVNKQNL